MKKSSILLKICLLAICLGCSIGSFGQIKFGLQPPAGKSEVTVPFQYRNGFIIVEVTLGNYFPVKFILDTGAEYTILSEKAIADLLNINYVKTFDIVGSDLDKILKAYLGSSSMKLGDLYSKKEDILILEENIFDFESFTGEEIYGIIGANTFRNFALKIDYERQELIFYRDQKFKPNPKRFTEIPVELYHSKPFLMASYVTAMGKKEMIKLLVDTGANIPILIQRDSITLSKLKGKLLPGTIAVGLGGELKGYVGRTDYLGLEEFGFSGIVTNYQIIDENDSLSMMNNRNGIIGNPLLSRFDIILDYIQGRMYLRPNKRYKKRFRFDRSGLQIITSGKKLGNFMIFDVFPGTPASEAGLQPGDQILGINGVNSSFFKIDHLISKLQKKTGKKITIKYLRKGQKHKTSFLLRDII